MSIPTSMFAATVIALAALPLGAQAPTPALSGYRADALKQLDTRAEKYIALAEAIPADKYNWRPAEGVRSVAEVLLHVSVANYGIPNVLGVTPPTLIDFSTLEKSTTDKAKIIEILKASFQHQRAAVLERAPEDAARTYAWFDKTQKTGPGVLDYINGHLGEHLGQLIAYARMNGIRPPWTGEG